MKSKAMVGAIIGAVVGAACWAMISKWTGFEIGYVAWGIGLLVGGGAKLLGGEGKKLATFCALLALASIFVGKMLAVRFVAGDKIREQVAQSLTRENYDERVVDAEAFAKVTSPDQHAQFMIDRGFTDATSVADVTPEELADFREFQVPQLIDFQKDKPDFETWQKSAGDRYIKLFLTDKRVAEAVVKDLNIIDIIFAVLGLATAYKLALGDEGATE